MRDNIILLAVPIWILWGAMWVYPLKRKLLSIYGFEKSNQFLYELAKKDDPVAKKLLWRTKVFIFAGLFGGVLIIVSK